MSNQALGSFLRDLVSQPIDASPNVCIVNDNARSPMGPRKSPVRKHGRCLATPNFHASPQACTVTEAMEATIRSHLSTRMSADIVNDRKKESRWHSMSGASEERPVTPKRKSCPASLLADMGPKQPCSHSDMPRMPRRISPLELDFCLSEILADAATSANLTRQVEEAINLADSYPRIDS